MFIASLPWHGKCASISASNAVCGYHCVCVADCTCTCVSESIPVSKRVVYLRLIRYVTAVL